MYVKAIRSRKEHSKIAYYVFRKARNKNYRAKFPPSNLINEEQTDCHIFFASFGISKNSLGDSIVLLEIFALEFNFKNNNNNTLTDILLGRAEQLPFCSFNLYLYLTLSQQYKYK